VEEKFEEPKGYSKAINPRNTDNTMAKRKGTKGQTMIYKTLHRKLRIERHEPH
jgi:hypothetical protein